MHEKIDLLSDKNAMWAGGGRRCENLSLVLIHIYTCVIVHIRSSKLILFASLPLLRDGISHLIWNEICICFITT
jgi:hypothetical protein